MARSALQRAEARIKAVVEDKPVKDWLKSIQRATPRSTKKALGKATAWWHSKAQQAIPVRKSITKSQRESGVTGLPLFKDVGRGTLKRNTQPFQTQRGDTLIGGVIANTHYAIWLAAGTRHIAGGRLLRWRIGDPPIKWWKTKRSAYEQGVLTNTQSRLPIVLPWMGKAHDMFVKQLKLNFP